MDSEEELIDIVNEDNEVVGKSSRGEAHKKGHFHRSLSVLILNSSNQILLQKRSKNKAVHPLSWDISTSEHVLSGESYEDAGVRSVIEELGVNAEIKKVTSPKLHIREYKINNKKVYENEIDLMLIGTHDGPFSIEKQEVDSVEFFTVDEIEKMIKSGESFTRWFFEEWESIRNIVKTNASQKA